MEVGYTFRNVDNSAHSYTVQKTREQDQRQEFHFSNPFIVAVLSWSGVSPQPAPHTPVSMRQNWTECLQVTVQAGPVMHRPGGAEAGTVWSLTLHSH
jgi:hypothetical protein